MEGDVIVVVDYLILNYKDGLCVGLGGGFVKIYLYVLGIDFVGIVEEFFDDWYKLGDKVVFIGWCVGEIWWGGYV